MRADDEEWTDDLDLKTLLGNVHYGERARPMYPPFYRFQDIAIDRNVKMYDKVVTDTAFANSIIRVWTYQGPEPMPPADKEGTSAFFLKDLEKFKARGGKVILIRFPSSGGLLQFESEVFFQGELLAGTHRGSRCPRLSLPGLRKAQSVQLPGMVASFR